MAVGYWQGGTGGPGGVDGKSAYQLALDDGFVGSLAEWLASLKGPPGVDGEPGASIAGPAGAQGIQGASGDASATTCKLTADAAALTSTTLANVTGLSFAVTAGTYYSFEFVVLFQSAATTTGLRLGLTLPAATVYSAVVDIPIAADGTAGALHGWLTSSGDSALGAGVQAVATTYAARIRGFILPSATGTLQVQAATEVASSAITIKQGSHGIMRTV